MQQCVIQCCEVVFSNVKREKYTQMSPDQLVCGKFIYKNLLIYSPGEKLSNMGILHGFLFPLPVNVSPVFMFCHCSIPPKNDASLDVYRK